MMENAIFGNRLSSSSRSRQCWRWLMVCALSGAAFLMGTTPVLAWTVQNDTSYTIRVRILDLPLDGTICAEWTNNEGKEILPGASDGCPVFGTLDQEKAEILVLHKPGFFPTPGHGTDSIKDQRGVMMAVLRMEAGGPILVKEQDRAYLHQSGSYQPNLYAYTLTQSGTPLDSSDSFASSADLGTENMTPANRDVRFLVTADPQYDNRLSALPATSIADQVLSTMIGIVTNEHLRGMVIAGDLTQNAQAGPMNYFGVDCGTEFRHYTDQLVGSAHFVFDGLGNHDLIPASLFNCSRPDAIKLYIGQKAHNTVLTSAPDYQVTTPHYSWDWHDVHFVQLNLFPGDEPRKQDQTTFDPQGALTFLMEDLENNVGTTGRPIVLFHHYGFDSLSLGNPQGDPGEWWTRDDLLNYWNKIAAYNVVAIFAGHLHLSPGQGDANCNGIWDPITGDGVNCWRPRFKKPDGATKREVEGEEYLPSFIAGAAGGGAAGGGPIFLDVSIDKCNVMTVNRRKDQAGTVLQTKTVSFDTTDPVAPECNPTPPTPPTVVNDKFAPLGPGDVTTAFSMTPCPGASAGTFTITATFTNNSKDTLSNLVIAVNTLSGDNVLCNADGGPGGAGATHTVQLQGDYDDGQLSPGEAFVVELPIGLQSLKPFSFLMDVLGVEE